MSWSACCSSHVTALTALVAAVDSEMPVSVPLRRQLPGPISAAATPCWAEDREPVFQPGGDIQGLSRVPSMFCREKRRPTGGVKCLAQPGLAPGSLPTETFMARPRRQLDLPARGQPDSAAGTSACGSLGHSIDCPRQLSPQLSPGFVSAAGLLPAVRGLGVGVGSDPGWARTPAGLGPWLGSVSEHLAPPQPHHFPSQKLPPEPPLYPLRWPLYLCLTHLLPLPLGPWRTSPCP